MCDPTRLKEYRKELFQILKDQPPQEDLNKEWDSIQRTITDAANKTIGKRKNEKVNWWDDECRQKIQEKNNARNRALLLKTRLSYEIYKTKRLEANKLCRNKKKKWIN